MLTHELAADPEILPEMTEKCQNNSCHCMSAIAHLSKGDHSYTRKGKRHSKHRICTLPTVCWKREHYHSTSSTHVCTCKYMCRWVRIQAHRHFHTQAGLCVDRGCLPVSHSKQSPGSSLPSVSRYVPGAQLWQEVAPSFGEYFPFPHLTQSNSVSLPVDPRYVPVTCPHATSQHL